MTVKELRDKALNKYKTGQVVNLRYRNARDKITERRKAEIIKFYPHLVLCLVDNYRESFTYADLEELTRYKKEE